MKRKSPIKNDQTTLGTGQLSNADRVPAEHFGGYIGRIIAGAKNDLVSLFLRCISAILQMKFTPKSGNDANRAQKSRWNGPTKLELGTSFSGLGRSKVSKISKLSRPKAAYQIDALDQYLNGRVGQQDGNSIRYSTFAL